MKIPKISNVALIAILLALSSKSYAQRFYSVVFDNLPKDMQLYARDDSSNAEIPISGRIEATGWDHISVVVDRNKERFGYGKSALKYDGKTSANFDIKVNIKAEIADYDFNVYACKETDSILIVKRTDVVAGDFYVAGGQSNGAALHYGEWGNKYCRTIARIPDNSAAFGAGDTLWIPSNWSWLYVGAWGLQLQRSILEKYGIPTCFINGSIPGSKITGNLDRNESDPATPTSIYGNVNYRIKKAKATRIRAFFWYQGEQEAIEGIPDYQKNFDKLFKYWQQDYPMVDQFVVMQINVLFNFWEAAGEIRDFQRRTKYLYPKTEHFSTFGLPDYDGVHYSVAGYQQLGKRLLNFLESDNYGAPKVSEVSCPDIKKVFYNSDSKNQIVLEFEEEQKLKWPADTTITGENGSPVKMSAKNFFFLDGDNTNPAKVKSGEAVKNRIILTFENPINAKTINYIPLCKPENVHIFWGPYLTNSRGLAAFSFDKFAIAEFLKIPGITTSENSTSVEVKWESTQGAEKYILYRKLKDSTDFVKLKELDAKILSYTDQDVISNITYIYKIQAISGTSESATIESSITVSPILGIENKQNDLMTIFPNPVQDNINVLFKKPTSGLLQICNTQGQILFSNQILKEDSHFIDCSRFQKGVYIISIKNDQGVMASRTFLK